MQTTIRRTRISLLPYCILAGACQVGVCKRGVTEFVGDDYSKFWNCFAVCSNRIAVAVFTVWLLT